MREGMECIQTVKIGRRASGLLSLVMAGVLSMILATSAYCQQAAPASQKPKKAMGHRSAKTQAKEFTLVGAGDIADCANLLGAQATAKLIEQIPGTVFAAGDLVYGRDSWKEFQNC